jgi:hypothetical protein
MSCGAFRTVVDNTTVALQVDWDPTNSFIVLFAVVWSGHCESLRALE